MLSELRGTMKRQYLNLSLFRAYSLGTLVKELFLFPKDFLSSSGRSSSILNIALFVTTRCNAGCAMCNIAGILNKKEMPDMPFDKITTLLDDVRSRRPSIILFGGEPFIRKDMVDIVKAVKKRGLPVGVFTNGLLLNEDTANGLMREGLDYIAFSLQGRSSVHDQVLGVPGAYDKMIAAMKLFLKDGRRRTKVVLHATICEYNIDDLENIARTGIELGVDLVRFGHPTFYSREEMARSSEALKAVFKDDSDIKATSYVYDIGGREGQYLSRIKAMKEKFGSRISFTPELGEEELKSWYSRSFHSSRKCLFVWRGVFVYPNGDMYPCESISCKMGNVFDGGFENAWNSPKYRRFRQALKKMGLFSACARCCKL